MAQIHPHTMTSSTSCTASKLHGSCVTLQYITVSPIVNDGTGTPMYDAYLYNTHYITITFLISTMTVLNRIAKNGKVMAQVNSPKIVKWWHRYTYIQCICVQCILHEKWKILYSWVPLQYKTFFPIVKWLHSITNMYTVQFASNYITCRYRYSRKHYVLW